MPQILDEPLLVPSINRFCMFPIEYPEIWRMYKDAVALFWSPEEIDLSEDLLQLDRLSTDERHFLKYLIAFLAASMKLFTLGSARRLSDDVQVSEARAFYGWQIAMENAHSMMYNLLLEVYCNDSAEKYRILHSVKIAPWIAKKKEWDLRWVDGAESFAHRLVACACLKGIFFSGCFCAMFSFKKRALMPGLSDAIILISRDEGRHCDFACLLYSMLNNTLSVESVLEIVANAVQIEKDFVSNFLPCSLIGIDCDSMCKYIEFVADHLLIELGTKKMFNSQNPFDWMKDIFLGRRVILGKSVGKSLSLAEEEATEGFVMDEDY